MSDITHEPTNTPKKKTSLGRGLGSLLGGDNALNSAPTNAGAMAPIGAPPTPLVSSAIPVPVHELVNQVSTQPKSEENQVWMISIDRLVANTQQPRQTFDADALRELSASIKAKGILQPITARRLDEKRFEIIAGERRWRAAQLAGLHEVPVLLKKVTERDSLEYAIIENIQRENLNPIEEAEALEHLLNEYSLTQQEVAERLGKERSSVANSLRLLSLPAEVKVLIRNQDLSSGHAKVLLGLQNPETQIELAHQAVKEKLSVRATEKLVNKLKRLNQGDSSADASALEVDVPQRLINSIAADLEKLIGTKVSIDYLGSKGKLQIHFYSDDQLTQIMEKIRASWEN